MLEVANAKSMDMTDACVWEALIRAVGPASLLVVIQSRLGAGLKRSMTPEDILQEALLSAWRARERVQWRGIKAFRSWLITVIEHRIHDAADHLGAAKRGGEGAMRTAALPEGIANSTTPGRMAVYREQASAMRDALESLDEEVREVVRLRLFEQRTPEEIARALGIQEGAARHRFRKGLLAYQRCLGAAMLSRSLPVSSDSDCSNLADSPVGHAGQAEKNAG